MLQPNMLTNQHVTDQHVTNQHVTNQHVTNLPASVAARLALLNMSLARLAPLVALDLEINHIEKRLVLIILVLVCTRTNKHTKIHVRIHSTVKVIRACMFIMWSVLEVTQRVPPTCITCIIKTYLALRCLILARSRLVKKWYCKCSW